MSSRRVRNGMLNLDTHILLFALEGELQGREKAALDRERWGISSIVLWEIAKLHQRGRIASGLDSPPLARALGRIHIWPLSREVCLNILALDFSSDPAGCESVPAPSPAAGYPV